VVRDAEKSTLVFNLNMGTVPVLNTETISKKATLALTTMAAKVENPLSSVPSKDTITAIDDVLSATTGVMFYASVTKSYKNPKDDASGSYCTVPVHYDFKDRETRVQAEKILRTACKINCATPYPVVLRECIRQTNEFFRGFYNTLYVSTSVDIAKMSLRVSYKLDKSSPWSSHDKLIAIPHDALNVGIRRVPIGFRMTGLITDTSSETMDTGEMVSASGSATETGSGSQNNRRTSRKDSATKSPSKGPIEPY
jgi:hypothetical protein